MNRRKAIELAKMTSKYALAQIACIVLAVANTTGSVLSPAGALVALVPVTTAPAGFVGLNLEACLLSATGGILGSGLSALSLRLARFSLSWLVVLLFVWIFTLTLIRTKFPRITPMAMSSGIAIASGVLNGYNRQTIRAIEPMIAYASGAAVSFTVSCVLWPRTARHAVIRSTRTTLHSVADMMELSMAPLLVHPHASSNGQTHTLNIDKEVREKSQRQQQRFLSESVRISVPSFDTSKLPLNAAAIETIIFNVLRRIFPCISHSGPRFSLKRLVESVRVLSIIVPRSNNDALEWLQERQTAGCLQHGTVLHELREVTSPLLQTICKTMRLCEASLTAARHTDVTRLSVKDKRALRRAMRTFDKAMDNFIETYTRPTAGSVDRVNSVYDIVFLVRRIASEVFTTAEAILEPSAFSTACAACTSAAVVDSGDDEAENSFAQLSLRHGEEAEDVFDDDDAETDIDGNLRDEEGEISVAHKAGGGGRTSSLRMESLRNVDDAQDHAGHDWAKGRQRFYSTTSSGASRGSLSVSAWSRFYNLIRHGDDHQPYAPPVAHRRASGVKTAGNMPGTSYITSLSIDELPDEVTDVADIEALELQLIDAVHNARSPVIWHSERQQVGSAEGDPESWRFRAWNFLESTKSIESLYALKTAIAVAIVAYSALYLSDQGALFSRAGGFYTLLSIMILAQPFFGQMILVSGLHTLGVGMGCLWGFLSLTAFDTVTIGMVAMMMLVLVPCFIVARLQPQYGAPLCLPLTVVTVLIVLSRHDCTVINPISGCFTNAQFTLYQMISAELAIVSVLFVSRVLWPYLARAELRRLSARLIFNLALHYGSIITMFVATTPRSRYGKFRATRHELALLDALGRARRLLVAARREPRLKGPFPAADYERLLDTIDLVWMQLVRIRFAIERGLIASQVDYAAHSLNVWTGNDMMVRRKAFVVDVYRLMYMVAGSLSTKAPLPHSLPDVHQSFEDLRAAQSVILRSHMLPALTGHTGNQGVLYFSSYAWQTKRLADSVTELGAVVKALYGTTDRVSRAFRVLSYKIRLQERLGVPQAEPMQSLV